MCRSRPCAPISIHALREEGDGRGRGDGDVPAISIHALREEGDAGCPCGSAGRRNFYPRPPRGGRPVRNGFEVISELFLSTPSARRATCDARQVCKCNLISIHALREEGDELRRLTVRSSFRFLSTPSARRATARRGKGADWRLFLSTPSARRATPSRT